jgi:hypothetical protein
MTVTFPTSLDFDAQWRRSVPAQANVSQWTSRTKTIGLPGASLWFCEGSFEPVATEREERALRVFVESLDGIVGITNVPRICQIHIGPRPAVASGAGNGFTLPLKGMAASTTVLEAGQFMTVPLPSGHARLVMLTADLVTNSSGEATAAFKPDLGEVPATDTVVETVNPYCPMRSTVSEIPVPTQGGVTVVTLSMREAL